MKIKKNKKNIWKIISIIFIVLFIVIIIGGLLRAEYFRNSRIKATESQLETAKNIAVNDLKSKNQNIDGYIVRVSPYVRSMEKNSSVMDVMLYNSTARHMYLIDVASGKILVYSKTEFYDGLDHSLEQSLGKDRRGPGFMPR